MDEELEENGESTERENNHMGIRPIMMNFAGLNNFDNTLNF